MDLERRARGLGAVSLAPRLWMAIADGPCLVILWTTDHSRDYYLRFGFTEIAQDRLLEQDRGDHHFFLAIELVAEDKHCLRYYLREQLGDALDSIS